MSRDDQSYTIFNPCTNEAVLITVNRLYLSYRGGDQTHTAGGAGIGQTTGTSYVFTQQVFDIMGRGGFEIVHLVAHGATPDLTIRDDPFDVVEPVATCR